MVKEEFAGLITQWREWAEQVYEDPSVPPPEPQQEVTVLHEHPELLRIFKAASSGTATLQSRAAELRAAARNKITLSSTPQAASLEVLKSCQKAVGTTSTQLEELVVQRSRFEEIARENARLKELTARSMSWVQASLQGQKPPPALRTLLSEPTDDISVEEKLEELDSLRKRFDQVSKENIDFQKQTAHLEKEVAKNAIFGDIRKQEKAEMKSLKAKVEEAERKKAELEDLRDMVKVAEDKDAGIALLQEQREKTEEANQKNVELRNEIEEMKQKYNKVSKENSMLRETISTQDRELQKEHELLEQSMKEGQASEKKLNFLKRSAADTQRRLHGAKADHLLRDPHGMRDNRPADSRTGTEIRALGRGSSFFAEHGGVALAAKLGTDESAASKHAFSDDEAF